MTNDAVLPLAEVIAAARELARAGRWRRAASLLSAVTAGDPRSRALLALAAAEVAVESDWYAATNTAAGLIDTAEKLCVDAGLAADSRWDLAFLRLRQAYLEQLFVDGGFRSGPHGRDPELLARLRRGIDDLREQAPDEVRRGWAELYAGLVADNLYGERDAAPAHYEAALRAGELADDLLAREALRHLGDHDRDRGDHQLALDRWRRAATLGARAGAVPGTLSQQVLLAVLARDSGDPAGAAALARETARWAGALGAVRIEAQAAAVLAGTDPTATPDPRQPPSA
jgi:hypothetical protein